MHTIIYIVFILVGTGQFNADGFQTFCLSRRSTHHTIFFPVLPAIALHMRLITDTQITVPGYADCDTLQTLCTSDSSCHFTIGYFIFPTKCLHMCLVRYRDVRCQILYLRIVLCRIFHPASVMIPDKLSRLRQIINVPAACLSTTALDQGRTFILITQTPDAIADVAVITPLHPLCRLVQIDISISTRLGQSKLGYKYRKSLVDRSTDLRRQPLIMAGLRSIEMKCIH